MRSSFNVSIGLTTPNGAWIGIRVNREIHTLVADRNAEAALDGHKADGGGLLTVTEGPPIMRRSRSEVL